MNIEEILKTYCFGCTGGYPRARFVRPEGERYVHMAGMINPKGEQLNLTIVCTAVSAFFTKEVDDMTFEAYMAAIGKDTPQLPSEVTEKQSIVETHLVSEESFDGQAATAVSLPSGPQRQKLTVDQDPPYFPV